MKRSYLVPVLTTIPFIVGLLLLSQENAVLDPLLVAGIAISYVVVNTGYALYKKTFQIHTLVEFSLVALIAYFALTWTI